MKGELRKTLELHLPWEMPKQYFKKPQSQAPRPLCRGAALGLLVPEGEMSEALSRLLSALTGLQSARNRMGFTEAGNLATKLLGWS